MAVEEKVNRSGTSRPGLTAESQGIAAGRGRLVGRRILIMGGGQRSEGLEDPPVGNGRAMAVLFAREGASIAVADIDPASAEETAERVRKEDAVVTVLTGDAADESDVAAIIAGTQTALGGIDGLVLNVGIGAGFGLAGTTVEQWDRVMAVNVRSQFLGCKLGLAAMGDGGSIVMIGSVASREVLPYPVYGASKAALESLCRQSAIEGAPKVRTNLLLPGLMDTALGRSATARNPGRAQVRIPARRQGTAWEVAYAALFLISDEAAYITGQSLIVDGGLTIGPRA
ncbi:MAG TPA: SDR family oxidoreductase [Acidimicrobiales bacterium]|jgi:NAD(P)-dependent dehydrogenase (short-subunit alcohol dehydrogenase family)|nr:SDR family oxidoreductase [Acidimicrobiales bacterium]